MIRVLHYVGKMDRGGMETLIMNLYRNIDKSQIQFDFAVHGSRNGDFEDEIKSLGGRFYQFPRMRKNPYLYRKRWRNFWKEHAYEYKAFHMHTNSLANIIAMEEAYRAKIPVRIIHSHSSFANKGKLQILNNCLHKMHRIKLNKIATHLIACSDKAAYWMYGGNCFKGKKVLLLNNGVNIKDFVFSEKCRTSIREELNISEDTVLLGQIGSFLPVKNHKFTISLMNEIKNMSIKCKMILIGDGQLKTEIEQDVKKMRLENNVIFLGKRSDVNQLLSALDIFIMPSLYEGLPVSLVEAQVNGVPCLISDTITRDVKFNDNVKYLPINEGTTKWIKEINSINYKHCANIDKIVSMGFDIQYTCMIYTEILHEWVE